ncbi:MAG: SDR family NAD(P)-dependent oxidoreductase [Myxococcota bacterium]
MPERNVFITGASSGLGAGMARRLAESGARVHAAARRGDLLEELARGAAGAAGEIVPVAIDVTDTDALVERIRGIDEEVGGLDLVIANAGVGRNRSGRRLDWENDVAPLLKTNVVGAIATLTAVLPRMVERRRGHLVGVSSLAGFRGLPRSATYSASKAAVTIFLESLRTDLAGTGVKVTCIHPGFIKTPMTDKNDFTMPFMLDCDEAVSLVLEGIERGACVVEFPRKLAWATKALRVLPDAAYQQIARRVLR